jgi:hypothetical protein
MHGTSLIDDFTSEVDFAVCSERSGGKRGGSQYSHGEQILVHILLFLLNNALQIRTFVYF